MTHLPYSRVSVCQTLTSAVSSKFSSFLKFVRSLSFPIGTRMLLDDDDKCFDMNGGSKYRTASVSVCENDLNEKNCKHFFETIKFCPLDLKYTVNFIATSSSKLEKCPEFVLVVKDSNYKGDPSKLKYLSKHQDEYFIWRGEGLVQLFSQLLEYTDNDSIKFVQTVLDSHAVGDTHYSLVDSTIHPVKSNSTDAGVDLHLVKFIKSENGVEYYSTGVVLDPPPLMWYMLVGRSSMTKSGYVIANGVGIIDSGYRGEVIVALRKVDPNAPEIVLPAKWVQVVPMQWYSGKMVYSSSVSDSVRGDTGGLGSGQFENNVPVWEQFIDNINQ